MNYIYIYYFILYTCNDLYNFELLWCNGVTVAVVHEDLLLASGWHFQMINDVPRGEAYAPQLN